MKASSTTTLGALLSPTAPALKICSRKMGTPSRKPKKKRKKPMEQ